MHNFHWFLNDLSNLKALVFFETCRIPQALQMLPLFAGRNITTLFHRSCRLANHSLYGHWSNKSDNMWHAPTKPGQSQEYDFSDLLITKLLKLQAVNDISLVICNCSFVYPWKIDILIEGYFVLYWFVTNLLGHISLKLWRLCPGFVGASYICSSVP